MPKTFKIIITGQVQGVGFRPFVFRLAKKHQLNGEVFNNELGVIIHLNSSDAQLNSFLKELLQNPPGSSIIISHVFKTIENKLFSGFKIIKSKQQSQLNLPLTPDFAICSDCKSEIEDPDNKRYKYPFTTCVNCGPRYAITKKFPFERENTSLSEFTMCDNCLAEYENPENRRFHSQTNSCPVCGIHLELIDNIGNKLGIDQKEIIQKLAELLSEGQIIAIKNTNGYLLCCDANTEKAIQTLRKKKRRLSKPFALLYPNLELIKSHFSISNTEEIALASSVAPIVILPIQKQINSLKLDLIAPNLKQMGVMLPSSALLELLMIAYQKPIIATSGNVHSSAIHSNNVEAQQELSKIADYIVHHNLDIQFPQDDSVFKFSEEQQIILRRSRGMAPSYLDYHPKNGEAILAMGAHLKSTFAFVPNQQLYVSQYFGNLDNYDVLKRVKNTILQYIDLFETQPETILIDSHPLYQSSQLGKELTTQWNAKCIEIQHHKAHFASVLGEHYLFQSKEKILGVIWDGTGWGEDNSIWGGEFFMYENHKIDRLTHFEYFNWIANDKMAQEPRLSLLSLLNKKERVSIREKFTETEWNVYIKTIQAAALKTSSVGRLFDAMASLLGLLDISTFEGEAAMLLEQCAVNYKQTDYLNLLEDIEYDKVPSQIIIQNSKVQLSKGDSKEKIAASFIYTLMKCIISIAQKNHIKIIACSGGVFQNAFLAKHLHFLTVNTDIMLIINRKLSGNDENISFGQLMYYQNIKP
jgi:hydrogenase maturation protein HypF